MELAASGNQQPLTNGRFELFLDGGAMEEDGNKETYGAQSKHGLHVALHPDPARHDNNAR